jgi:hypothetical protein
MAVAVMALAAYMATHRVQVPLCASPAALGLFALIIFFAALGFALGRTPAYEKYLNRAQRHLQASPEQALADLSRALEIAPEKQKSVILKQRGELLSKLGRTEQALVDLSAHAAAPVQGGAAQLLSSVSDIDIGPSTDASTLAEIDRLQKELVQTGTRQWIGYCQACRAAVVVDPDHKCTQCGAVLSKVQLVEPTERAEALAKLTREEIRRRRKRSLSIALTVVALLLCVVLPLATVFYHGGQSRGRSTPTPKAAATPVTPGLFRQDVFSFSYPTDWWVITPAEVSVLLKTSLKGMTSSQYSYIGGVFAGGLDNCKGCAQIVVIVARDSSLTGTLTDEQYEAIRAANEKSMTTRLLSHRKTEISSMPAVESIHIGLSGDTKLWEYIIVPPKPGIAYLFSCSSAKNSFAEFEPVFRQAINTLRVGEPQPMAVPTLTPRPIRGATPLPAPSAIPRTYTVQPGDTLSQIAKNLGVTMDALAAANGIDDPDLIQPGQVLTVPLTAP